MDSIGYYITINIDHLPFFSILYSAACALITLSNQMIMRWFGKCTGLRLLGEKICCEFEIFYVVKKQWKGRLFHTDAWVKKIESGGASSVPPDSFLIGPLKGH